MEQPEAPASIATNEHRPGEALIKKEYLKPIEEIPRLVEHQSNDSEPNNRQQANKKHRGTFKKRPIDAITDDADTLCRLVAAGGMCAFADSCKYSHDVNEYMKRKEKDLGEKCPCFQAYGFCRYGVTCRFARSHIECVDGTYKNIDTRPMDQREMDPEVIHESNVLTMSVRDLLRKNQYEFKSAPQGNGKKEKNRSKTDGETLVKIDQSPIEIAEPTRTVVAERKQVDFKRKIYIAPLTTVGNLPFRRLLKKTGADITCGEMAMAGNLLRGQQSEWALLRRHESEDVFGVQIAGAHGDQMARVCELLTKETDVDFIDINMGCPIDVVCRVGAGSALMNRPNRMMEVISGSLTGIELGSCTRQEQGLSSPCLTVKLRTGWSDKTPVAHKLVSKIQHVRASKVYINPRMVEQYPLVSQDQVAAITIHGRSRLQRYTKSADWDYVYQCYTSQDDVAKIPFIGGGDVLSYLEFDDHLKNGMLETCMLGRGALIKPWLPIEIKEQRHYDISSQERFEYLRDFVRFGLEHWGADQKGVNRTRRYLLEWQSFLCRYIPVGLLEVLPQHINSRPAPYYGRNDLEALMASDQAVDWIKLSEMLLGPVPDGFAFQPKHKANAYETTSIVKSY